MMLNGKDCDIILTPSAIFRAGVAELADAADLKSAGAILVGSSPAPGTNPNNLKPVPPATEGDLLLLSSLSSLSSSKDREIIVFEGATPLQSSPVNDL
jgi:hypothetical protein